MSIYTELYPAVEEVLEMLPEELGPFVLRHLNSGQSQKLNRYNFTLGNDSEFIEWAGDNREEIMKRFMVAWMWLEKQLFVAPQPGQSGDWAFITPRGLKVLESEDFESYQKDYLLPIDNLDPILVRKVKQPFLRGDYDNAILQAFKEVEVRVRKKGGFSKEDIGVKLMRKAFGSPDGPLVDVESSKAEQNARMELFTGGIGFFKNPSSHRDIVFFDPKEVADIIHFSNQLLRIVDSIDV